jgi:hypothetical protein
MSEQTKWTPGPWRVERGSFEYLLCAGAEELAMLYTNDGADEPTWYPVEANARVMALAPEMYEALHAAEAILAKHVYPKPDAGPGHPWSVLQRVRDVLKKAEGRS